MYRVESLKLFGDISKVSDKYKSWHLKDDENEIKDNRKLKTLLNYHNSRFDHIKEKYDFLSYQVPLLKLRIFWLRPLDLLNR